MKQQVSYSGRRGPYRLALAVSQAAQEPRAVETVGVLGNVVPNVDLERPGGARPVAPELEPPSYVRVAFGSRAAPLVAVRAVDPPPPMACV